MPDYKLTYFDARGRAEAARLLFAAAGVPYEDIRVTIEEWRKGDTLKANARFGVLPNLEFEGHTFSQSRAIVYHLAREFGYYTSDKLGALQIDEVVFILEDFSQSGYKARFAPAEKKEEMMNAFFNNDVPKFTGWLEKILSKSPSGYFYGDKMTVADIVAFDYMDGLQKFSEGKFDLKDYPHVKAMVEKVGSDPGIKKHMESRPDTQF